MIKSFGVVIFIIIGALFSGFAFAAEAEALALDEVLRLTEINSPRISAAKYQELAANKDIAIARANYFPTLNAEALDSTGFAASSSAVGITGLMGSPFRSGLSGGLVAQQIIWDFGRTQYDVKAAGLQAERSKQDTRVTLYQIKQLALETYYECAFYHTQRDIWRQLSRDSALITKEAQHFVATGQASIVDRYLSKAQTEEAITAEAFFAESYKKSLDELAVIMGVATTNNTCPQLTAGLTGGLDLNIGIESSPILARAIVDKNVAEARLQQEKAGSYPKIVAVASTGAMEKARLVHKQDYAAGIGVIVPIIDLHTTGKVQRASAELAAKTEQIEAETQFINELNAKYDSIIQAAKIRLQHLETEHGIANKAFAMAKQRYFALEGELIDLREAFKNLTRVQTEINATRLQLLQASGSKALVNGAGG